MKSKVIVTNIVTGQSTTLGRYAKQIKKELISFSQILKKDLLSQTDLDWFVSSGVLKEINIKNKKYLDKNELLNFISAKK